MHAIEVCEVSDRRACRVIGQLRTTQRYEGRVDPFQTALRDRVIALAQMYGRYGYKMITGLLNMEGFDVGKDRVYTIWREEGLKVPMKHPKRSRLWLADGSCIRLRPEYQNHVWSYDFVSDKTSDGRPFRILNIIDEHTRECLAAVVVRRFRAVDVLLILAELFIKHGAPKPVR